MQLLAYNLGAPPSATGIPSKGDLLGYTKRLCLENPERQEPSYLQMMLQRRGAFDLLALDIPQQEFAYIAECVNVRVGAVQLHVASYQLKSISTAVYMGGGVYSIPVMTPVVLASPHRLMGAIDEARSAVGFLCVETPSAPGHACMRIDSGPLTHSTCRWVGEASSSVRTQEQRHCVYLDPSLTTVSLVPAYLGGHTSCFFSPSSDDAAVPREKGTAVVFELVKEQLKARESFRDSLALSAEERELQKTTFGLSLDMYVPRSWLQGGGRIGMQARLDQWVASYRLQHGFPLDRSAEDSFKVNILEEAPTCEFCHWSPAVSHPLFPKTWYSVCS